ncbi:hypothetical protein DNTS_000425 [Danionella cerebrum]|nr:hypothetical protein DNTS_000425 [Danionella translucida]TRZ03435.1 hypothetical protein DNTS_000425 [Danionella translucida]
MDPSTLSLFQRVSEKLGWNGEGGLEEAEKELRKSLKKSRRPAMACCDSSPFSGNGKLLLSDSDSSEKENHSKYKPAHISDDEYEGFEKYTTQKSKSTQSRFTSEKPREPVVVLSSESDGEFESFLNRMKTPKTKVKTQSVSSSGESLKCFIVDDMSSDDDFIERKPIKGKARTPKPAQKQEKEWGSPVFLSDSDDESNVAIKSTWRTRHSRPQTQMHHASGEGREKTSQPRKAPPEITVTSQTSRDDPCSSEEEFQSLLDRVRQNQKSRSQPSPEPTAGGKLRRPCLSTPSAKHVPARNSPIVHSPVQQTFIRPQVSQTEPRALPKSRLVQCTTPGCFLQTLSAPGSSHSRNFKQSKEELTGKLYQLYNTSVFDGKLPADMSVTWNNKMRKTAGYCISGQERGTGKRYARIELSVKVCDSADRLRDTLVHEMCHAATWLINNVRDGHGPFWRLYAQKAMLAHPELPMVSRCHSYDINYKYQYQCSRCKNTIGRHSKSLDTSKFVCALCTGQLSLLTPSKPRAPTPFANFVKENYGSTKKEFAGQSHAEIMRKLSVDFASKTRLSQS